MSVSRDDVRRIADLARLRIEDDDLDQLTSEMNAILEHVDTLRSVDTRGAAGVAPSDGAPDRADPTGPQEAEPLSFGPYSVSLDSDGAHFRSGRQR